MRDYTGHYERLNQLLLDILYRSLEIMLQLLLEIILVVI